MEPNEQNTNKQKTHRYREQTDSSQRGWGQGMWDWVKKVTGLSKIFFKNHKTRRHRQQYGDYQRERGLWRR